MKDSTFLLSVGSASLAASFAVPVGSIPLLVVSAGAFLGAEIAHRHEEKYIRPIERRKYHIWLETLNHGYEYLMGVQQAAAQNRIDWQAEQLNQSLNLSGTLEDKYFAIFTQGGYNPQRQITIPVQHQEVEDAEPATEPEQPSEDEILFAGAADLPEQSLSQHQTGHVAVDKTVDFPVEDIADLIARNTMDVDNCSSIMIACPKGTGKSSLLRAAIYKLHQHTAGTVQISVFNGKEDRKDGQITSTFCGLENDSRLYINAGDPNRIEEVYSRLARITQRMESNHSIPMVQVLDEYNNQLIAASIFTELLKEEQSMLPPQKRDPVPNYLTKIRLDTTLRVTKGRSKLVADWITSHSPLAQDVGLNTMIQQSLTVVVLGRGDKLDAIHTALNGRHSVVKNPQLRAALYEQFLQWEQSNTDPYKVVCLTNLAGRWRMCLLPKYPNAQPNIAQGDAAVMDVEIIEG